MYCREPRGFAFVEFVDPYDASEAQYHMNRQLFGGREITVVVAAESRKRPEEMRRRTRTRYFKRLWQFYWIFLLFEYLALSKMFHTCFSTCYQGAIWQ